MPIPSAAPALVDGAVVVVDAKSFTISHRNIGELELPSGRIVAADALVEPRLRPFERTAPPGGVPVYLALARSESGDERIAAAWLRWSEEPITTWESAALVGGRRPATDDYGYGVDSATGSFLSDEAADRLASLLDDRFAELVADAMGPSYADTRQWAMVALPGPGALNVAFFSSGYGDGAYPTYWGLDAAGSPVVLLTDFSVLEAAPPPADRPKPWWKFW